MTGPMDIPVSTNVVFTVWTTLHVTNRLDIVTVDVTRDIQAITAAKVNTLTEQYICTQFYFFFSVCFIIKTDHTLTFECKCLLIFVDFYYNFDVLNSSFFA